MESHPPYKTAAFSVTIGMEQDQVLDQAATQATPKQLVELPTILQR